VSDRDFKPRVEDVIDVRCLAIACLNGGVASLRQVRGTEGGGQRRKARNPAASEPILEWGDRRGDRVPKDREGAEILGEG